MSDAPLRFGAVELRPQERRLLVDGQTQTVGSRAFDLLLALVDRRDRLVTKSELLDLVWPGMVVEESNLPVHVSALRKVLGVDAIATIPGRGYRFTLAPEPARQAAPERAVRSSRFEQPSEVEPIIGREEVVYDIVAALIEHRLVDIVGEGGIGKTRLARTVWRRLREDFIDGVWWVDLAPLQQPEQVIHTIAQSVGEPLGAGDEPADLARALAQRSRMLLVLDNCEQVAAGVVRVVVTLLAELPMLRLLLTSRVPLHLAAEHVWRLEALPVPDVGATLTDARACAAFELFEVRACASDQRFVLESGNLALAIELCRRLEGHPLAIEMAAARAPQIGLAALLRRLDERLRLLRASDPAQPDRQISMRVTLDWSCSQLDDPQRAVLRRLAVFGGTFGLEAAQQVAADALMDEWAVLDALAALVDCSLVQVQVLQADRGPVTTSWVPRYRLAETTRLYAFEQLRAADEVACTAARHGQTMARLADLAVEASWTLSQAHWLARFGADQTDWQVAFDTACASGDADLAARIGQALATGEALRGPRPSVAPRAAAARHLFASATAVRTIGLLWNLVAPAWSPEWPILSEGKDSQARVDAWRAAGDAQQLYLALRDFAIGCACDSLDVAAAAAAQEMAWLEAPDWSEGLRIEGAQVHADLRQSDPDEAGHRGLRRALELAEHMGDAHRVAWLRCRLAEWATATQPADEAVRLGHLAVRALESLNRPVVLGGAWSHLCAACLFLGDEVAARQAGTEAHALLSSCLSGAALFHHFALLEARRGNAERAIQSLAHADRQGRYPVLARHRPIIERLRRLTLEALSAALGQRTDGVATHLDTLLSQVPALDAVQADALATSVLGHQRADVQRI